MISDKQKQLAEQCRVVAALAKNISDVHRQLAELHAKHPESDSFVDMVGRFTAERMEILGNMLNNMDAVCQEDEWMTPIFKEAHRIWPARSQAVEH